MSDELVKLLATFFYVGNIKKFPGTVASAAAVLLYIILQPVFLFYLIALLGFVVLGFFICEAAEEVYARKDPQCVVIDEVAGMLLACFLLPLKPWVLVWALILFRFFDITKIYPIKRMESMKGGAGIMMDDVLAGLLTNLTMHVAIGWGLIV